MKTPLVANREKCKDRIYLIPRSGTMLLPCILGSFYVLPPLKKIDKALKQQYPTAAELFRVLFRLLPTL